MKTNPNNSVLRYFIIIATCSFVLPLYGLAQNVYKQTGDSFITVAGTSTLHEWTMTSKEGKYQAEFEINAEGAPTKLKSVAVAIPSESLKSGHSGSMDKNAYSSLKTKTYKTISFSLVSATLLNNKFQCSGNLTISGVTKQFNVDAEFKVKPDKSLLFKGSKPIKMTDFQIEPPSFMFGAVKTGDDITISFNVNLTPVK